MIRRRLGLGLVSATCYMRRHRAIEEGSGGHGEGPKTVTDAVEQTIVRVWQGEGMEWKERVGHRTLPRRTEGEGCVHLVQCFHHVVGCWVGDHGKS